MGNQLLERGCRSDFASSTLHTEALTCLYALKWARLRGWTSIRIYIDSSNLVSILQGKMKYDYNITWTIGKVKMEEALFHLCDTSYLYGGQGRCGSSTLACSTTYYFVVLFLIYVLLAYVKKNANGKTSPRSKRLTSSSAIAVSRSTINQSNSQAVQNGDDLTDHSSHRPHTSPARRQLFIHR